ncbi:hypothetical protein D3C80_783450 [compost metagenome]
MRGQIIDGHIMGLIVTFPCRATLLEPDIARRNVAIRQGEPAFKAKTRTLQRNVILHPFAQPRLDVDVIRLQPHAATVQQTIIITQIHSHLHDAVLTGQAGEIDLSLSAVTIFTVQPGKLRDREFCTLT